MSGDFRILAAYSLLIGVYKWAAAVAITWNTIRAARHNTRYGSIMLGGILVFDYGLIMDRLLPLFEPIRFGWFLEIGGFAVVASLGAVIGQELLGQYRDKLALEGKVAGVEKLMEMQRNYYPVILEGVEEARRARHDLRHHLSVLRELASSGQYGRMEEYLQSYGTGIAGDSPLTYCENDIVDVILRHFAVLAEKEGVRFRVDTGIPADLSIDSADICGVLSNLLENALEACIYVNGEKYIAVTIKQIRGELILLVENSFNGYWQARGDKTLSRKRQNREGSGLLSVKRTA
jgi:signal transduction histidine kinase